MLCLFAIPALGWSTTFPELLSDVPTTSVTLSQTGTIQAPQTQTLQKNRKKEKRIRKLFFFGTAGAKNKVV